MRHMQRLLKRYPLPAPIAIHSVYRNAANTQIEEPDALIGHIRIWEAPRRGASFVYSTFDDSITECNISNGYLKFYSLRDRRAL